jgi:hypothetical protein
MRNTNKVLVRKCEGKRPFERPSHRWEDNMKMDLTGFIWLWIGTRGGLL